MTSQCDCCQGAARHTPASLAQRAGLETLAYRVGTHSTFLQSMIAALGEVTVGRSEAGEPIRPLRRLTTRDRDDPTLALLDAWATVADVLTFYQERIANEGYLRTATERRSVLELARLLGYQLRPGVSATAWLAFTLDPDQTVTIDAHTRVRSVPGPGETAQTFETDEPVEARTEWSRLRPRQTEPQRLTASGPEGGPLYLAGTATALRPPDALLLAPRGQGLLPFRVTEVVPEPAQDRTRVGVRPWLSPARQRPRSDGPPGLPPPAVPARQPTPPPAGRRPRSELGPLADAVARARAGEPAMARQPSKTATRVLELLDDLMGYASSGPARIRLAIRLAEVRTELRERLRGLNVQNSRTLGPWLGGIVAELDGIAARQETDLVSGRVSGRQPLSIEGQAVVSVLTPYREALTRPASIPPASPANLGRSSAEVFTAQGDVFSQLLTAFRPDLGRTLREAWRNIPEGGNDQEAHALRIRAGLFGANAQPGPGEEFEATVAVEGEGEGRRLSGSVSIGQQALPWELAVLDTRVELDFDAAGEQIRLLLTETGRETLRLVMVLARRVVRLEFRVQEDRLIVAGTAGNLGSLEVETPRTLPAGVLAQVTVKGVIGGPLRLAEDSHVLWLDAAYDRIQPESWVLVERPWKGPGDIGQVVVAWAREVTTASRQAYGVSGPSTRIVLDRPWLDERETDFDLVRLTRVHAQSEQLVLAERPVTGDICQDRILLDGLYDGLRAGRWLIVEGERTDVTRSPDQPGAADAATPDDPARAVPGVPGVELAMLSEVAQHTTASGVFTELVLAQPLAYCYRRDTVVLHGNVAKASHGEQRTEVLGSGDATIAFQRFTLKRPPRPPLTYRPAPTPTGAAAALEVRVDEVEWDEAPSLVGLGAADRRFVVRIDDDGTTAMVFGDGRRGARLPTGIENVQAVYRTGIGREGNLDPGRLRQLATRPLGVSGVTNPLRSSGGADHEGLDSARASAPRTVTAFGRFVSVSDAEDFARTFAGIGKASAARLSDGQRQVVHLTIAGVDDAPIDPSSDLHRNLVAALRRLGDPFQAVEVESRQLLLLLIEAGVRVDPDRRWDLVEPRLRAALLEAFGFGRRELGQDVVPSDVLGVMHRVPGVAWVDLEVLRAVGEADLDDLAAAAPTPPPPATTTRPPPGRTPVRLAHSNPAGGIDPAQLALLDPDLPDTLLLKELPP